MKFDEILIFDLTAGSYGVYILFFIFLTYEYIVKHEIRSTWWGGFEPSTWTLVGAISACLTAAPPRWDADHQYIISCQFVNISPTIWRYIPLFGENISWLTSFLINPQSPDNLTFLLCNNTRYVFFLFSSAQRVLLIGLRLGVMHSAFSGYRNTLQGKKVGAPPPFSDACYDDRDSTLFLGENNIFWTTRRVSLAPHVVGIPLYIFASLNIFYALGHGFTSVSSKLGVFLGARINIYIEELFEWTALLHAGKKWRTSSTTTCCMACIISTIVEACMCSILTPRLFRIRVCALYSNGDMRYDWGSYYCCGGIVP